MVLIELFLYFFSTLNVLFVLMVLIELFSTLIVIFLMLYNLMVCNILLSDIIENFQSFFYCVENIFFFNNISKIKLISAISTISINFYKKELHFNK